MPTDSAAFHIKKRKNDQRGHGLLPRVAKACACPKDLVLRTKLLVRFTNHQRKPCYSKAQSLAAPCQACGRLFRPINPDMGPCFLRPNSVHFPIRRIVSQEWTRMGHRMVIAWENFG
eukprot:409742-Rhodomonas_salina.1